MAESVATKEKESIFDHLDRTKYELTEEEIAALPTDEDIAKVDKYLEHKIKNDLRGRFHRKSRNDLVERAHEAGYNEYDKLLNEPEKPFTYIITNSPIVNRIVNDPLFKELGIELTPEDIQISSNMILIRVNREDASELYRLDLCNDRLYVQAPLTAPYVNFVDRQYYNYVIIPLDSEEGKKIVTTANYKYDVNNINENNIIKDNIRFRVRQDSM